MINALVKPLEWTAENPYHVARALGGHYSIERVDSDVTYFELKGNFIWPARKFATIKEAKESAQADFEQRIRSALASVPAPSGAEPVAWRRCNADEPGVWFDVTLDAETAHVWRTIRTNQIVEPLYAAAALTASEAEATSLRRKLEELRQAYESARYVPGDHPVVPAKIDAFMKVAARTLSGASE
jgi:hypothetical protein